MLRDFVDKFEKQDGHYIIAYSYDNRETAEGIKVEASIPVIAQTLHDLNEDVKHLKSQHNRLAWLYNTIIGRVLATPEKMRKVIDTMVYVEMQMAMIVRCIVHCGDEDILMGIKTHPLSSKLFQEDEESTEEG